MLRHPLSILGLLTTQKRLYILQTDTLKSRLMHVFFDGLGFDRLLFPEDGFDNNRSGGQ